MEKYLASGYIISLSLFATTLICAALGSLYYFGRYVNDVASVFFNLRIVSKSPAENFPPISTVLELQLSH